MPRGRDLFSILLLAFLWSPSFLAIRVAVEEFHPITLSFVRCLFTGGFFYLILILLRQPIKKTFPPWKILISVALLINAIPFTLCSFGELYVDSTTAGIMEGLVPMLTIFLGAIFLQKSIDKWQFAGIVVGFLGVAILFYPTLLSIEQKNILGLFLLFLMSLFFAIGFFYTRSGSILPTKMKLKAL